MKTLIVPLLLCIVHMLNAQINSNDSLRISGIVFEQDSLNPLGFSRFNLDAKNYSSDEKGQFSFWAQKGEIVRFSHVGFKDTYIQINDSLQHMNYMLGVFLTRDTFQISEVIVMPRYENLALKAKTMPLIITPEQAYASQNVRSSTYQALTQNPIRMDAEMNHRMVLQERVWSTVYKTQVPPHRTIGVSPENVAQMRLFLPKNEQRVREITMQPLNANELDLLLRIYEQRTQRGVSNP